MTYAGAIFLVIGFIIVASALGVIARAKEVVARSKQSLRDLRDPALDDDAKEKLIQGHAVRLFALFGILVGIAVAALGVPVLMVWLADRLGLVSLEAVLALTVSWQFIVIVLVASIPVMWLAHRLKSAPSGSAEFENRYSTLDRLLHGVVFNTMPAQAAFADIEDRLYGKQLEPIALDRPLFITALPRAGTTMLLDILTELPEFATHRYRDMPFLLCPLMWSQLAQRFRKTDTPRERAHGDGMMVSLDSPEAFEDMIWKLFFPKHYKTDRIVVWDNCDDAQFLDFFRSHMRKIIWLRQKDPNAAPQGDASAASATQTSGSADFAKRYASKNNGNIARLAALPDALDSAIILVPFRDPIQHAASLLRQHKRFLKIHEDDPFARKYMAGVGHFDFGANLKPIDFNHWLDQDGPHDPLTLAFWIRYWIVGYEATIAKLGPRVRLLGYDQLCENPAQGVEWLAARAEVRNVDGLRKACTVLKTPSRRPVDTDGVDPALIDEAKALYDRLIRTAEA